MVQASKDQAAQAAKPPKRVSRDLKPRKKTVTKIPVAKSVTADAETPEVPDRPNTGNKHVRNCQLKHM